MAIGAAEPLSDTPRVARAGIGDDGLLAQSARGGFDRVDVEPVIGADGNPLTPDAIFYWWDRPVSGESPTGNPADAPEILKQTLMVKVSNAIDPTTVADLPAQNPDKSPSAIVVKEGLVPQMMAFLSSGGDLPATPIDNLPGIGRTIVAANLEVLKAVSLNTIEQVAELLGEDYLPQVLPLEQRKAILQSARSYMATRSKERAAQGTERDINILNARGAEQEGIIKGLKEDLDAMRRQLNGASPPPAAEVAAPTEGEAGDPPAAPDGVVDEEPTTGNQTAEPTETQPTPPTDPA